MKDYLLKIKVNSGIVQPITGDQINGAFLYFLFLKDKEKFHHFYQQFLSDTPPYLFSSLIPAGFLPVNSSFLVDYLFKNQLSKDERKKIKKLTFLPKDFFADLKSKKGEFFKLISPIKFSRRIMVSIKNEELFYESLIHFAEKKGEVYLRIFDNDFSLSLLEEFISFFLGKKISSGFSFLRLEKQEEISLPKKGDYFINFSPFVPAQKEKDFYQPLFFDFFIKYPKTGFLIGKENPFKKKIILIKEGSVFHKITTEKEFFFLGKSLMNVSFKNPEVIQVTYTIPYFFNL